MDYIEMLDLFDPGTITGLNLLYEGSDFEAWAEAILPLLEYNRYITKKLPRPTLEWWTHRSANAAVFLRSHTSHGLLARVPKQDLKDGERLFNCLKQLARPFRLMDLPPELREIIFTHALPSDCEITEDINDAAYPMLQISTQLRREALAVFYTHTEFVFRFSSASASTISQRVSRIREWSVKVVGSQLKLIKHMTFGRWKKLREIHCTWTKEGGIQAALTFNPAVDEAMRSRVEQHVNDTNLCAQACGLQGGEALLLFALRDLSLWKDLWDMQPGFRYDFRDDENVAVIVRSATY